ncbi:MAG: 4Fe-4S binding protein, partial [Phycisphaerae bacterium]
AIGNGRKAALHIHRTLSGEDLLTHEEFVQAGPEDIKTHVFTHTPRHEAEVVPARERRRSNTEVHRGLPETGDHNAGAAEARRCFSCGVCNECNRCVDYCPEGILVHDDSGYRFNYDYCKGCGICASQCPRGVIYMAEL